MDYDPTTAFRPAGPGVIFRDFGDEMVVANLDSGVFYSLEGAAAGLWSALMAGHGGAALAAAYPGPAGLVETFLGRLLAEGLLVPAGPPAPDLPAPALLDAAPPRMERFDDLQGLLLVDPIHDVGEAGWPLPAALAG